MRTVLNIIRVSASILVFTTPAFGDDLAITDYIVNHNPQVLAVRDQNKGILGNARVEGKASAYSGVIGSTTDQAAVGITLTIPLIDQKEKADRAKSIVDKEASVRDEVSRLLQRLRQNQTELKGMDLSIRAQEENLARERKRVEVGMDYYKSLYEASKALMDEKARHEKTIVDISAATNQLILLVDVSRRDELRGMLK